MGDNFDDMTESSVSDMTETTVTEQGPLDQIGSSIKGMLAGLACFIIAWPVLFYGATRVEWAKVFNDAVPVQSAKQGQPAYLTGVVKADQIGDENIAKGNYLTLTKNTEVYAWKENTKSETKTEGRVNKKKTTTTTYSYSKEWTSHPEQVSQFNQKFWTRHAQRNGINPNVENPVINDEERAKTIYAQNCTVNGYNADVSEMNFKGGSRTLQTKYIKGVANAPRIGDKRIRYSAQPSFISYTLIGSVNSKTISPYFHKSESQLAVGPGNFTSLLANIKKEDQLMGMIYFFGGFILMAIGLNMLLGPITTLLEFIPVLGDLGAGLIRIVLTVFALIVSALFYWLIKLWFVWVILLVGTVGFLMYKRKFATKAAATA